MSHTDPQSARTLAPSSRLPVEEPALQKRQHFLPRERPCVRGSPVPLEHADIVLERLVAAIESIVELEPFEDHVLRTGLVRLTKLRVHDPTHGPDRSRASLDPDDDPLFGAHVVDPDERSLRIPAFPRASPHTGIQSLLVSGFKNMFSFLFSRGSAEEHVARYVIREHDRGRSLTEILEDKYVQNRLTAEQQRRLLDRPEILETFSGDTVEAAKASVTT